MNKWQKIAPAGLAAVAAGAVAAVLSKKNSAEAPKAEPKAAKKVEPKNLEVGSYSFVSGFMDASTVEVKVKYDADRYSFAVVEENFIAFTSDSHVALITGADFNAQLEYVPYYSGEDFNRLSTEAKAGRQGFAVIGKGFRYVDGDSVYVCLPVDASSYLLITAMRSKGSRIKLEDLPTAPEFVALVESVEISR